jgi:hypothetical protein
MTQNQLQGANAEIKVLQDRHDKIQRLIQRLRIAQQEITERLEKLNYTVMNFRKNYDIHERINIISHFYNSEFSNQNYKLFINSVKAKKNSLFFNQKLRGYPYLFHKRLTKKELEDKDIYYWELAKERQEKELYVSFGMNEEMEIQYENHEKGFLAKHPKYAVLIRKENKYYNMVTEYKNSRNV